MDFHPSLAIPRGTNCLTRLSPERSVFGSELALLGQLGSIEIREVSVGQGEHEGEEIVDVLLVERQGLGPNLLPSNLQRPGSPFVEVPRAGGHASVTKAATTAQDN